MRGAVLAICSVGLLLYPLLVYQLANTDRTTLLVAILATLLALRLFTLGSLSKPMLGFAATLIFGFCALAFMDEQLRVLKLYPVLISFAGAGFFLYSLWRPPSAIERFARRMGMQVPTEATSYLRGVTLVWLCFFCLNAMAAGYTALASTMGVWTLYNGLVSYLIIGVLLLGEWLYRRRYQRLHSS